MNAFTVIQTVGGQGLVLDHTGTGFAEFKDPSAAFYAVREAERATAEALGKAFTKPPQPNRRAETMLRNVMDKDEANCPQRLAALSKLADEVSAGDFYTLDEGRRSPMPIAWPGALGLAVTLWIGMGRPPESVPSLLPLIARVLIRDWCTVWEDPGDYPSNAGGSALPDRVSADARPDDLACELLSIIDDMGLMAASQQGAADQEHAAKVAQVREAGQ